jgi:predicted transcriptional regulator
MKLKNDASPLKEIRRLLNISQAELATHINQKQSSISHYETGKRRLDIFTAKAIQKLAAKHNIHKSLDFFFS